MIEAFAVDRAAQEPGMREDLRAKRPAAKARQPTRQRSARPIGQHRVRKNQRLAVAVQNHFTDPGQSVAFDAKCNSFIYCRHGKSLPQKTQRELASGL